MGARAAFRPRIADRITSHHPGAFWFGTAVIVVGVVLHLPMYIGARAMGYRMAGMSADGPMVVGMLLILVGLVATLYGLLPPSRSCQAASALPLRVKPLDGAKISVAHIGLLVVMAAAVTTIRAACPS